MAKIETKAGVKYTITILNSKGEEVEKRLPQTNLLLDRGMDLVARAGWEDLFRYAAIGTSNNPTRRTLPDLEATMEDGVVTVNSSFFSENDLGRTLLLRGYPEELRISFVMSPESVSVRKLSGEIPEESITTPSDLTVFYVTDQSLGAQHKRTNNYISGENGTDYDLPTESIVLYRTYLFSQEAEPVTIREIGWSDVASGSNTINGRSLLQSPVVLNTGDQLKVRVELSIGNLNVTRERLELPASDGFDISGEYFAALRLYDASSANRSHMVRGVRDNGASVGGTSIGGLLDGRGTRYIAAVPETYAFPTGATAPEVGPPNLSNTSHNLMTANTYVPGSFETLLHSEFAPDIGNNAPWKGAGIKLTLNNDYPLWLLEFDEPQTKLDTHRLRFEFLLRWRRVLE